MLVRADERRIRLHLAHPGSTWPGSPGPYGRFFLAGALATVDPGAPAAATDAIEHPGEELVYVLEGALEFEVDGRATGWPQGDALHFRTVQPHRWCNPAASRRARAVWMALRPQ